MQQKQTAIGIVGGGVLGMTLALRLAQAGFKITLLEKSKEWGGLASGININGTYLEKYYHHWFRSDTSITELIKELGLENKQVWLPSRVGVYKEGKIYNFSTAFDIIKFPLLNIFGRLRLGLVTFYLQKFASYKKLEQHTAFKWSKKYFGKKVTQIIWEPLLKGKFGNLYQDISMGWLWARIHDRASSRPTPLSKEYLGYMEGGFQLLIDSLQAKLKDAGVSLLADIDVKGHSYKNDTHQLVCNQQGKEIILNFDAVVGTMPGPIFTKIFKLDADHKKEIKSVKYIGATCMILELNHSLSDYYWLNITEESFPFLAVIEHTNFVSRHKYGGKYIVYIAKYIDPQDDLYAKEKDELLDLYIPYLKRINSEFSESWIEEVRLYKSAFAQHIVNLGYKVIEYESGVKNLYLLNFSQIYPHDRGTNYAVEQANNFAKILINKYGS